MLKNILNQLYKRSYFKVLKLILMFPFYILCVILCCIISPFISLIDFFNNRTFFNPLKLYWTDMHGKKVDSIKNDFYYESKFILSPLIWIMIILLMWMIIDLWKYVLCFILIITLIILVKRCALKVRDFLFKGE